MKPNDREPDESEEYDTPLQIDSDWAEDDTPPPVFELPAGVKLPPELADELRRRVRRFRTLLIEDNPPDAEMIRELLGGAHSVFELECVDRLAAGLERLAEGGFDVVLLDLSLPDSHGMETFLKLHTRVPNVPVVVLSGLDDAKLAVTAVKRGAQDFLVKGHVDANLLVRSMRYAIERARRLTAERALQGAQEETRIAREIQQKLFPVRAPTPTGFDIGGASYPAEGSGGDYFDYFWTMDGQVVVIIGDVAGSGVAPALVLADTRAYLRAVALAQDDVGKILELANRLLTEDVGDDRYVTLFLARIDPHLRSLAYASAGHPPGFVLDRNGVVRASLPGTSPPLGASFQPAAPRPPVTLETGDLVVLLTNGVANARSPADVPFGTDRALEVVRVNRDKSARLIAELLYRAVCRFCKPRRPADDITAVVVKVGPG